MIPMSGHLAKKKFGRHDTIIARDFGDLALDHSKQFQEKAIDCRAHLLWMVEMRLEADASRSCDR